MRVADGAARLLRFAAAALLLAALAPAASSADDGGFTFKWSNGFKLESEDGDFALKFGGRIQADWTFVSAAAELGELEDGFEFRRARLFFEGTIYKRVEFKAQYDFAGGDADFKDVYVGIKSRWGTVRFGHYKEYFSLEELTSSKYLAFLERSLPVQAFSPSRNSGAGVHGKRGDAFNWGFGVFYDADDFGFSQDEDRIDVTGRIAYRPLYEDGGKRLIHLGLSASEKDLEDGGRFRFRARPEAHLAPRFVSTGRFAADGATLLDLELAGVFGPFWFAAEHLTADVDAPAAGDPSFDGFYVQAGYYLTGEHRRYKTSSGAFDRQKPKRIFGKDGGKGAIEIAARYSTVDLTGGAIAGGEQDDLTLAINWYLNPATRLMVNFVNADVDGAGDADYVLVRWQVDF